MAKRHSEEIKVAAGDFFRRGYTIDEISKRLNVGERILYVWREKYGWAAKIPAASVEETLDMRIRHLANREDKTDGDLKELLGLMDKFGDLAIKLAEARKIDRMPADAQAECGNQDAARPKRERGERGEKKGKKPKNDISGITPEMLAKVREEVFFPFAYQKLWWEAKQDKALGRNRFILKSRQIGATYYFAWEALEDAILTGDNQIFLSSSRDQAEVFKSYIVAFAKKFFDVELSGRVVTLSNGAELRFVSTNAATAASYHGHLYVDEVFFINNFKKVWDQASGMASHKKWRTTVFSVPSTKSHPAYEKWSGAEYNRGKPERMHFTMDIDHAELHAKLAGGWLGPDRWWRHIVTVEDAEQMGCNLFDIEDLKAKNSEEAFTNKYLCRFIDDAASAFKLALLLACGVDAERWPDYDPAAARPFGNRPVAIGYDPSRTVDDASVVVMAVPLKPTEPWRLLKRLTFRRKSLQYQAERIKEICQSHNVIHLGIDVSGLGSGVFEHVQGFYPLAEPITYSIQSKTALVVKAMDVMQSGRLKWLAGGGGEEEDNNKAITRSFLMIRQTSSDSGQITYTAARSNTTGHADVAWAITHALKFEPLNTMLPDVEVITSK